MIKTYSITRFLKIIALNIYSPLLVLLAWQFISCKGILNPYFFPPPTAILSEIIDMFRHGILQKDMGISLFRIGSGLVLGGLPALVLGILMGRSKPSYYFLNPLVSLAYPIPKIAVIPFIILFLGIGELSKIIIISLGAFFLILINTFHGVVNIDKRYFEAARIYTYTAFDRWFYIILPGAMPAIFNGLKLAVGMCYILVVASEFLGGSSGIGYRIWTSWESFEITRMFGALIVLSLMGWISILLVEMTGRFMMPWKDA